MGVGELGGGVRGQLVDRQVMPLFTNETALNETATPPCGSSDRSLRTGR